MLRPDAPGYGYGLFQRKVREMLSAPYTVYDEMVKSLQFGELLFRDEIHVSQIRYFPETVSQYRQIEMFSADRYDFHTFQMFGLGGHLGGI